MTFGPGSMVDLPKHSVLIAGLDYWTAGGTEIFEAASGSQGREAAGAAFRPLDNAAAL